MKEINLNHGLFSDTYEEQLNTQGYTLGDKAEWVEKIGYGLKAAYTQGCISDSQFKAIIERFSERVIVKNLKKLEG